MTEGQFLHQHQDSPWDFDQKTRTFSVEMSTLQGTGGFKQYLHDAPKVQMPTGKLLEWSKFTEQRDAENEVTGWEFRVSGYTYQIFND